MAAPLVRQWVLVTALLVVLLGAGAWMFLSVLMLTNDRAEEEMLATDASALGTESASSASDAPVAPADRGAAGPSPAMPSTAQDVGSDAPRATGPSSDATPSPVRSPEGAGSDAPGSASNDGTGGRQDPPGSEAAASAKPSYVDPNACKKCHLKAHKSWKTTRMATAYDVLAPRAAAEKKRAAQLDVDADYTKNAACLRCHTTGYGTETGYPALPAADQRWNVAEEQRATRFQGVSCEACHGPGSLYGPYKKDHPDYARSALRRLGASIPASEAACETCHKRECPTMPPDYVFDVKAARGRLEAFHEHVPLKSAHAD